MKFGPCPPADAEGCLLAHKSRLGGRTLKKGHMLSRQDCADFAAAGIKTLVVARLEPDDLDEDTAAERLARAASGSGVHEDAAFTGRTNLYAETDGILIVDATAVAAANRVDAAITLATLANFSKVSAGRMIATAKIISFGVPKARVRAAEEAARAAVRIAGFTPRKVGLVATELPHLKPVTMDKTRRVLENRLGPSGSRIAGEKRVPHEADAVADAMHALLREGADFLILFGASAVVDRHDVLPAAVDLAGGTVRHLGMPVDPGNLLMLAELDAVPVLGAPGCARSPKENGFDWVLDRLLADLPVSPADITSMGVGGLLMEIGTRPQPRETRKSGSSPRVAAIILGAGRSTRMGGPNKLLASLDGKTLIRHVADAATSADLVETILVTGHSAEAVSSEVSDLELTLVHNPDFQDGMAGSIRAGVNALPADTDAVIILLGDMPRIGTDVLHKLIAAYTADDTSLIVTATADGKRGNPVLWDRRFFPDLKSLRGDVGARHIIAQNSGLVREVEVGTPARLDLDTPEALRQAGGSLPEDPNGTAK